MFSETYFGRVVCVRAAAVQDQESALEKMKLLQKEKGMKERNWFINDANGL